MNHFLPCPGCARHVQARDALCPFCGETLPMSLRSNSAPMTPSRRLGRAATFAFGAAIAASTACGGEVGGEDAGATDASSMTDGGPSDDGGSIGPLYGSVPGDSGLSDSGLSDSGLSDSGPAATDAGFDAGGISPLYGGVPVDAGDDAGFDAGGGISPLYGAAPPPD